SLAAAELPPEEHGLVSCRRFGVIGHVQRGEVHADPPHARDSPPAHEKMAPVGKGARDAVVVPGGHRGDARQPGSGKGRAVSHRFTRRYLFHVDDTARDSHDWAQESSWFLEEGRYP